MPVNTSFSSPVEYVVHVDKEETAEGGGGGGGYLIHRALLLAFQASAHHRVDADLAVEGCGGEQRRVPGTPLDIEAPLVDGGQLVDDLEPERGVRAHSDISNDVNVAERGGLQKQLACLCWKKQTDGAV